MPGSAGNKKTKPVRDGNPGTGDQSNNNYLYMNFSFFPEPKLASITSVNRSPSIDLPRSAGPNPVEITLLTSLEHPLNKRFTLDDEGEVKKDSYQNAYLYDADTTTVSGIDDLARVIEVCSADNNHILIRGSPSGQRRQVQRLKENFPEHPDGVPWVMLDFDNISPPDGIDPVTLDALEWIITKLPPPFHNASFFHQQSASAGILQRDGTPLKPGVNGHVFFWLDRRIPGKVLSAYLTKHCIETGFYQLGENQGGGAQLTTGVDPATIRSSVQPHFIASPTIGAGVQCRLELQQRQGLVRKSQSSVCVPEIDADIEDQARRIKAQVLDDYKRRHGYQTRTMLTSVAGRVAVTHYSVPARNPSQPPRTGRTFLEGRLLRDEKFLTLYFEDEGSPGSWYVCKDRPQVAYRYGDTAALPLKELSLGAHEYVRDELRWFSEVPHRHLDLVDGYLPALAGFATAKVSLVVSPTGSGKTTAAIEWIRGHIDQRQLVLYAAPTIALVKQMRDDLTCAGLSPAYYENVWGPSFPRSGVIVTTNESLPRLLKEAYDIGLPHVLIFDEIHQGVDRFMGGSKRLHDLESALSKARQSLLLTGTLTDVQRHAIVEISKHALGSLTESDYCCFEFAPFKQNPLQVVPTARFDSDFATLLEDFQNKLRNNEALPRFVMLLDTSKMEMYRRLVEQYGLADHSMIVSRPENSEEEIEAARTSIQPILISSPLFGLGLNFAREPDILWARFDHMEADTSQIIQAVNRANRGGVQCDVRIYGNVRPDVEFTLPDKVALKAEVSERLQSETSVAGLLEEHFQLDRVTYQLLRKAERNSLVALSSLVRDNAIQNFNVVECNDLPEIDKDKAKVVKSARAGARQEYRQAISNEGAQFAGSSPLRAIVKLEQLCDDRKNNWRSDEPRLERELQKEEAGIFMGCFGISDPVAAQKVKPVKVLRLFGEVSPWTSSQYARDRHPEWAKAEAEKTEKYVVLLKKLEALQAGEISAEDLSAALTRNGQLGEAFQALASSDLEFQSIGQKIETQKKARDRLRTKGGEAERVRVGEKGLELLRDLLEPVGVTYGKKTSRGRQVTDNTQAIVPSNWDVPEMILNLERQAERLRALPKSQKEPIVPTEEESYFGEPPIPRQICEACVFFHQNACSRGRLMDWQSSARFDPDLECDAFRGIKIKLRLE